MFELPETLLGDLERIGLLVALNGELHPANEIAERGLKLFVPLLQSFDIRLVPVSRAGCPVRFCTGILNARPDARDQASQPFRSLPGGGQSHDPVTAALGCLGELAERLSLCSIGADDPRVYQTCDSLFELDVGCITGFSDTQIQNLAEKYQTERSELRRGKNFWSVPNKRRVLVENRIENTKAQYPSFALLFGEHQVGVPGLASTVGCAVWSDLEGARESAYLELVERDAVAQAWYNRLGISCVQDEVLKEFVPKDLRFFCADAERDWTILSVATDLDAHVMLAISYGGGGKWAAFGSSAAWDVSTAICGAIREALQAENALGLMDAAYPVIDGRADTNAPSALHYARTSSVIEDLRLKQQSKVCPGDLEQTFSFADLQRGLEEKGIRVWEFDATRPDIKVPCIKLLSPDLCSWEPRFGKQRLYQGVVQRGLRDRPADEAEFAARPFPS